MALSKKKQDTESSAKESKNAATQFAINRTSIKEMYRDDESLKRNVNKGSTSTSNLFTADSDTIKTNFHNAGSVSQIRQYTTDLNSYSPIFQRYISYLSNLFLWRYIYVPRRVKEKAESADYEENYLLMGEAVDGLAVETSFPATLSNLFLNGAVYLYTWKSASSKTITTFLFPAKYCRTNSQTQFGTYTYQLDLSYFDSLGLSSTQLETIFTFFPAEIKSMYEEYQKDKNNLRWQQVNPKVAGAILLNSKGVPTQFNAFFSIDKYDKYSENELERNSQQLDRIVSHEMPTWEDKLIVDIPEMTELHKSMAKIISKNSHTRLLTSFGKFDVHQLSQDSTKENKTLQNAYNAIYDNLGSNNNLFNGSTDAALAYSLTVEQSYVWNYIQQLVTFYNVVINNAFNFHGYQCDFQILPITGYNEKEMLVKYKEGATLGIAKLEYAVAFGCKQVSLGSKYELEDFLKLDKLKPLSTSYTQNDNSKSEIDEPNKTVQEEEEK